MKIYENIDSTNKEAARLIASGVASHGMAIIARHQTGGLGQYGRKWHSEAGLHLALSIILLPSDMPIEALSKLSMKVSLAVVRALQETSPFFSTRIKWPNDIYADGKKLAGILIENSLSGNKVQHCIIGLGMNVNETYFPESIHNAISLTILSGEVYSIEILAEKILHHIMSIIDQPDNEWKKEYHHHLFRLGENQIFEKDGNQITGRITDVDDKGKLVLEINGNKSSFNSHQIKWII